MEAVQSSETSVHFYMDTHHHIPVDSIFLGGKYFNIWYEYIVMLMYGAETWIWNKAVCPFVGAYGIGSYFSHQV
jgi:hypothetical protein